MFLVKCGKKFYELTNTNVYTLCPDCNEVHQVDIGLIYMVWKITPELQTAIDHVSEQKAVEFLEQAIKHISDGKAQLGTQQPKDGKNICFKPLVKQGSQDTLLIAIPERAFKAYNYSSFQ